MSKSERLKKAAKQPKTIKETAVELTTITENDAAKRIATGKKTWRPLLIPIKIKSKPSSSKTKTKRSAMTRYALQRKREQEITDDEIHDAYMRTQYLFKGEKRHMKSSDDSSFVILSDDNNTAITCWNQTIVQKPGDEVENYKFFGKLAGRVIGKEGVIIKGIQAQFNVRCTLQDDGSHTTLVMVGKPSAVKEAMKVVRDIIEGTSEYAEKVFGNYMRLHCDYIPYEKNVETNEFGHIVGKRYRNTNKIQKATHTDIHYNSIRSRFEIYGSDKVKRGIAMDMLREKILNARRIVNAS